MANLKLFVYLIIFTFSLSGCGGEGGFTGGECEPGNVSTSITNFDINGTYAPSGGVPVIDDSGSFSLDWDVESSCTYTYTVTLSENAVLGDADDIELDSGTCGFGLSCREFADIECVFSTDMPSGDHLIACGSTPAVDVSTILDLPSPQSSNVYFFLSVTNEAGMMSANTSSQAIVNY